MPLSKAPGSSGDLDQKKRRVKQKLRFLNQAREDDNLDEGKAERKLDEAKHEAMNAAYDLGEQDDMKAFFRELGILDEPGQAPATERHETQRWSDTGRLESHQSLSQRRETRGFGKEDRDAFRGAMDETARFESVEARDERLKDYANLATKLAYSDIEVRRKVAEEALRNGPLPGGLKFDLSLDSDLERALEMLLSLRSPESQLKAMRLVEKHIEGGNGPSPEDFLRG